jgi:hypothetical protein
MTDERMENRNAVEREVTDPMEDEQPDKPVTPLERLLRKFREISHPSRLPSPATRKDLGKDKSKALFVLLAAAIAVILLFLVVFSKPQKQERRPNWQHDGQPDLGRRVTPGQDQKQDGSITPLLSADTRNQTPGSTGEVTPEDINRTSHLDLQNQIVKPNTTADTLIPPAPANSNVAATKKANDQKYALSHIDFSDPALKQEYAKAGYGPDYPEAPAVPPQENPQKTETDLKKPSLVFVRNANVPANPTMPLERTGSETAAADAKRPDTPTLDSILPAGTRLVARLESPVSTAVAAPVVAAIEYNYERDGEIVVPAGSKAVGKLEQANSSGYVSLRFDTLEFPDGTTEEMDATSMGLDFAPVKGLITGKRRSARFLVQTLTGLGTMASYLVGAGNLSGSLSESALLRERLADNVAIAGQNELNQLAFNQNIMVTVPGNTRIYIVLQKSKAVNEKPSTTRNASYSMASDGQEQRAPSLQELRQLLELKREVSQLYQQGSGTNPSSGETQEQ